MSCPWLSMMTVDSSSDSVTVTSGVLYPDYDPLSLYTSCTATFKWTVGANVDTTYTTSTAGLDTVNYVSGALEGTITNIGTDVSMTTYDDGSTYKMLRYKDADGDYYASTDCALTAHPAGFSFDIVYDGMIFDRGTFYTVDATDPTNTAKCLGPQTQKLLFTVQDVTVQGTQYKDALLTWYLDTKYPFVTISNAELTSIGVVLPTSAQTGGISVTGLDIAVPSVGTVGSGDVGAATGTLNDFSERTNGSCS